MSVAVPLYLRSCGTCYSSHLLSPSIGLEILHPSNPGVNTHMTVALWPTLCGRGSGAILCKTLPSQVPFWKAGGYLQASQPSDINRGNTSCKQSSLLHKAVQLLSLMRSKYCLSKSRTHQAWQEGYPGSCSWENSRSSKKLFPYTAH